MAGWWGDGVATFAAAVTRAMALAEEAKYAYTLAEEEKLRVNPHSNLPKIIGKRGVGNWEATRKQRGSDANLREAGFLYMLKRGLGAISNGKQSDPVSLLYF